MKSPVAIDAGRFVLLIRYLHILQSSLSKTESVRTEAVLVTVCLSLCWLWEGKENYQGRGGEKVNKKLAKRDKRKDDVDGVYRAKHVLGK